MYAKGLQKAIKSVFPTLRAPLRSAFARRENGAKKTQKHTSSPLHFQASFACRMEKRSQKVSKNHSKKTGNNPKVIARIQRIGSH